MEWASTQHVDHLLTEILWEKEVVRRLGMAKPFTGIRSPDRVPAQPWVGASQRALEHALRHVILGRGPRCS
jgi:hypothetical protein